MDGGIDGSTIARVVAAGANVVVTGAAIFDSPDPEQAARQLRSLALEAAGAAQRR